MTNPSAKLSPEPKSVADLIALSDQIAIILKRETNSLLASDPRALQHWDEEKSRAMALYQRDLGMIRKDTDWAKKLSPSAKLRMTDAGARLQSALNEQSRLIARRRHVTEGLVQAIAKDVATKRQGVSPYGRPLAGSMTIPQNTRAATALTLNAVV
jgi:hypothetical protein